MAFTLPQFNIMCNTWRNTGAGYVIDTAAPYALQDQECALVFGKRVNTMSTGGTGSAGILAQCIYLLLPAGTDIRGPQDTGAVQDPLTGLSGDFVQCPTGLIRLYVVAFVDDVGKGWPNEHRIATLFALPGTWPAPYG